MSVSTFKNPSSGRSILQSTQRRIVAKVIVKCFCKDLEAVVGPMQNGSAVFLPSGHLRAPTSLIIGILLAYLHFLADQMPFVLEITLSHMGGYSIAIINKPPGLLL